MKKLLIILISILSISLFTSCNQSDSIINESPIEMTNQDNVRYHLNNFDITTRASLSEAGIKSLNIYVDGELNKSFTSYSSAMATPSLSLSKGTHYVSFVASQDGIINGTSSVIPETFGVVDTVIVDGTGQTRNITLNRIITKLVLQFNDSSFPTVDKLVLESTFYNSFQPTTLLAGDSFIEKKEISGTTLTAILNKKYLSSTFYCPSNEFLINLKVTFYKGTTLVKTYTFNNVEMMRNRQTTISGYWFDLSSSSSLQIGNTYLDEYIYNFN